MSGQGLSRCWWARVLQGGRAVIGAKALGIAIGAHEDALRYANERVIKEA
ncbi:hypothetical protein [Allosediminivita pacifica]|uniref:Uncharacterized protein n=1 Tax=Allosediminivita pacifica TaxID=1267769 RepID=A0A2T6AQ69_9RHOB|nr:hypothetical protein [Allosediminivita pacifica]PTX45930.1 hypothetical protein C8N44_11988 [Allosediminivita pacifica]GGB18991.1 hypothetical protein GCM10011324_31410 [Allosediminivita pacifica]